MTSDEDISWIESRSGRKCSPLGKKVAVLLAYVAGGGIYNAPIKHENVKWDDPQCVEVVWSGSLISWDSPSLSKLWIAANRMMLRVEVEGAAYRFLRLTFHERRTRTGSLMTCLPTCEELIRCVDHDLGLITIICPVCGRRQQIDRDEYLDHISKPGHPYTCGNDACPSHTEMVPVDPDVAAYKAAMEQMME
jgi:hypothetical protein